MTYRPEDGVIVIGALGDVGEGIVPRDLHILEAAVLTQIVRAVPGLRADLRRLGIDHDGGSGIAGEFGRYIKRAALPGGLNRAAVDGGLTYEAPAFGRFSGLSNQGAALHGEEQGINPIACLRRLPGGYPERAAMHGHNKCIDAAA